MPSFKYFLKLPVELQYMIWDCYRNQRGLRHYLMLAKIPTNVRFYACINIDIDKFVYSYRGNKPRKQQLRWPPSHPASGEEFEVIRLVGHYRTPELDIAARSIVATNSKDIETWAKKALNSLFLRINFAKDLVFVDGGDTGMCLRPISNLLVGFQQFLLIASNDHWFQRVRHLAIQLKQNQTHLDYYSLQAINLLSKLENLYLVVYRDPDCSYGAPRSWRHFDKALMDEYNFFPYDDFCRLHPHYDDRHCKCGETLTDARSVLGTTTPTQLRPWCSWFVT
ncbi:hypothetical protein F4781DRAFT_13315 [Annulohypoxylon bovei var. microspora]|nr:hypothetical protein F4781DRAFT_13315 [Annulohypoxylon bovei var. microspora]